MQGHSRLKGEELAKEVDKQPWDPSVKALTQFPSVLENMDKNLSWTSSLGDAYANQQQDLINAVQAMRQQAHKAGHLNSNEQEKVTTQGNTIIIEPAILRSCMYLPMIPGSCMASRSSRIQAGTLCRESSLPERGSDLESGSASGLGRIWLGWNHRMRLAWRIGDVQPQPHPPKPTPNPIPNPIPAPARKIPGTGYQPGYAMIGSPYTSQGS